MKQPTFSPEITILQEANITPILMRYMQATVTAGFPSPAADYMEEEIDFNQYLRPRPSATFVIRVKGDSMVDAHIPDNSLLIVDRSVKPTSNCIVIAVIDNEFTVKRFIKNSSGIRLMPANEKYKPIPITEHMDFKVWGVVTQIIINAHAV